MNNVTSCKLFRDNPNRRVGFLLICPLLLLMATSAYHPRKMPLNQMNWLLGTWSMQAKKGILYERWHYVNDSTFQSRGYLVKSPGDTVTNETVQLTYRKGIMYYTSTVNGQNNGVAVPFKITTVKKNEFIAENPQHDYPQRIGYKLESPNNLYAWIDGKENNKYKKIDYRMNKIK